MAFMRAQHIAHLLLGGYIDSAALETALTTNDQFAGAWKRLLRSGTAKALIASTTAFTIIAGSATAFGQLLELSGTQLAASDSATEAISNNSTAIKTVVTNSIYLNLWNNVPANKTRLQARINASGSKLKRQEWTSSGTWTAPGTPIVALSVFAVGSGGSGGVGGWNGGSTAGEAGSGGSGAESATKSATTSLPITNQTITVASGAAATSSFGSFLTAAGGVTGSKGGSTTSGGGSDVSSIYDITPSSAIWQPNTASKQGGNGGNGGSSGGNVNGTAGLVGLSGTGGVAGTVVGGPAATSSGGGSGIGTGGGSGAIIYPSGAGGANGGSVGSGNYGCGGGGGSGTSVGSNGGTSGDGLVIAYWVEG